jgi:competence protein ComEA
MIRKTAVMFIALVVAGSLFVVAADETPSGVVNINTADADQLQLLPRIGPALAGRIIDFRDANGPFASVEELVAVKGIGENSLTRLQPYVTTKGATTLDSKVKLPRSSASAGSAGR